MLKCPLMLVNRSLNYRDFPRRTATGFAREVGSNNDSHRQAARHIVAIIMRSLLRT